VQTEAKTLLTFLRQMGMTPATREKIKPAKPNPEDEGGGFDLMAALEEEHANK
jgi:hypothetical protein